MQCPHCNQEHPDDSLFCPLTGKKILIPGVCPECGKPIDPKWLHCSYCGRKLNPVEGDSHLQEPGGTGTPRAPGTTPGASKTKARSQKVPWRIILGGIGLLLIAAAVVFNALWNRPSAEQIATMTATAWTATPTVTATPPATPTPTEQPVSEEVRANADQAFASGLDVYLYDPQPRTVSLSDLDATYFSLRTIRSDGARAVTNVVFIWKVNAEGAKEYMVTDRGYIEDWTRETGEITFNTFNLMRDMVRQQYVYGPDTWVLQAWIGMTPLYGAVNQQYVDDPVYLDVFLMAPEERDGNLWLSDSSRTLSNIVRIEVAP